MGVTQSRNGIGAIKNLSVTPYTTDTTLIEILDKISTKQSCVRGLTFIRADSENMKNISCDFSDSGLFRAEKVGA